VGLPERSGAAAAEGVGAKVLGSTPPPSIKTAKSATLVIFFMLSPLPVNKTMALKIPPTPSAVIS
jgi:hypothetical protein